MARLTHTSATSATCECHMATVPHLRNKVVSTLRSKSDSFEIGWSHTFESLRVLLTVARFPISVDICLMTSLSWSF